MKTEFDNLDKIINLEQSNLIFVSGRPAMGKTEFALNIINNVALKQKIPTLLFSLELSKKVIINDVTDKLYLSFKKKYLYSKEQLIDRLVALQSKIDMNKIERTKMRKEGINILGEVLTTEEEKLFNKYLDQVQNSELYIDDTANVTIEYIEQQCKRLKQSNNIRFVVIDYLQLLNYENDIEQIATKLKALTKELNLTILVLSQLSRKLEKRKDKRPVITDLGKSKALADIADIVMFLYRENYYNIEADNTLEIIVAKNK